MPHPFWILRHHSPHSIQDLSLHPSSPLLIAGDATGRVSISDLRHYRQSFFWSAHTDSILGVQLHGRHALTHGRDNTLKLWLLPSASRGEQRIGPRGLGGQVSLPSRLQPTLPQPQLVESMEVNALNFARFSLLPLVRPKLSREEGSEDFEAVVAVPHTLDAAYFDIFHLPSGRRVHEAVSRPDIITQKAGSRLPIIMSLHLFRPDQRQDDDSLACLAAYEDGRARLWSHQRGAAWMLEWERRLHSEPVMDVALSHNKQFGVSVGADDRIALFSISDANTPPLLVETGKAGKSSISISQDDSLIAIAGWDGRIRLYASDTLKELGSLLYHRETVETVSFFQMPNEERDWSDSEEEANGKEKGIGGLSVLAAGGRDGKISLWHIF